MKHKKAIEFLKKVFPKGYGEVLIDSGKLPQQKVFTHYDPEVENVWKLIEDYEDLSEKIKKFQKWLDS